MNDSVDSSKEHRAALKAWRDGLVGLTRQSALIKFRAHKSSSLLIDAPSIDEIQDRLASGNHQVIRGDVASTDGGAASLPTSAHLHCPRPDAEVGTVARSMMRKANAEFLERGLLVLYMAFGLLEWRDVDGTEMVSPVLLVPVELTPEGPRATPRLVRREDDPVVNPALALRLGELGIELPTAETIEGQPISAALAQLRRQFAQSSDTRAWTIKDVVHLGLFSFWKEAMYKDLKDNEERILAHPMIRALATSDPLRQSGEFQFEPEDPAEIDRLAPPETTPLVLDADSSQRGAILAALKGRSFVMDGPPGTGKSQTIANMIGVLLHAGKNVLFVSEKIAALEVVRNRLTEAKLDSYVLELHSHKTSRKQVAAELMRTLENRVKPPTGVSHDDRTKARKDREQLNAYAVALNETRDPLGMSLHHVFGLYAKLRHPELAPDPETPPDWLTSEDWSNIQHCLGDLSRVWPLALQGASFLWRDVIDSQPLEVRLYQAQEALTILRDSIGSNLELMTAFDLEKPSDTARLLELIAHRYDPTNGVQMSWLTAPSLEHERQLRDALAEEIASFEAATQEVLALSGVPWTAIPSISSGQPSKPKLSVRSVNPSGATWQDLRGAASHFTQASTMLADRLQSMTDIATSFGLPAPKSFVDVRRILRLIQLRTLDNKPEHSWFSPAGSSNARQAATILATHARVLADAESTARGTFTPGALKAPLVELQERFTNLHRGLRKLSADYRSDKRVLAAVLTDAGDVKNGIKHLQEAIHWGQASDDFERLAAARSTALGHHWQGGSTDFSGVGHALDVVDEVISLLDGPVPSQLIAFMTSSEPPTAYAAIAEATDTDIRLWSTTLASGGSDLAAPHELLVGSIEAAIAWLSANSTYMEAMAARGEIVWRVIGKDQSTHQVEQILAACSRAWGVRESLAERTPLYSEAFGPHYCHEETDLGRLDAALSEATVLRGLAGGRALTDRQALALQHAVASPALADAHQRWLHASRRIIEAFATSRHAELNEEMDDYDYAPDLIEALRSDSVGQQQWFAYQRAREALKQWGLDEAVEFCRTHKIPPGEVGDVVAGSLLRGWIHRVVSLDDRIRPLLATDRDALVESYRELERRLINLAHAEIISAANARRPSNINIGESAAIRREGMKQKRHKPVRDLISDSRNVVMDIKPVFMMSPLAVSQYLTPDMTFDVVIFDEASQITPGDAVNSIYRGRQLILAGDDKQLPPTSFFERQSEDENEDTDVTDFQSVLELAKGSGSLANLGLRWHYRSRHEDLIGFSNYKFYEGKLVTFPSAHVRGDDVGIQFFDAEGLYRRGGGSNNPLEAAKVAERVIEHFTKRPEKSLGVVTFSVQQVQAVQDAIDEARENRRDLDRFFDSENRLDGFFIRALEQVQGDERDVIIFSIGYGPDEAGKVSTNFGALNRAKGWRRLNVGVTRARQRIEVVSSMRAGQIPPSQNENVEYFRAYLDYAERGLPALALPCSPTGLDPESPFEESVLSVIRGWGYTVEPQVGAAGYRVDLGVRHPEIPSMFVLGVECDGYQYHSAPAARDRDRLRDQILTGLGWRMHRIWSTAWSRDRESEERRLRAAIEDAITQPARGGGRTEDQLPARAAVDVEAVGSAVDEPPSWTTEYRPAPRHNLRAWVDPSEPGNGHAMVDSLTTLVQHESPVHVDVALERLRDWWGIGRVGSKIRANIHQAIDLAGVDFDGTFLTMPGEVVTSVRRPVGDVQRRVEQVHDDELAVAVTMLVRDAGAVSRAELVQAVARIFGWQRTGQIVDASLSRVIDDQVLSGKLEETGDRIRLAVK